MTCLECTKALEGASDVTTTVCMDSVFASGFSLVYVETSLPECPMKIESKKAGCDGRRAETCGKGVKR